MREMGGEGRGVGWGTRQERGGQGEREVVNTTL